MVAKKHKSKRIPAAQRYKIEKKVRDHARKVRRDAKKSPFQKVKRKDPGIPNAWPFKEKLLQEIEVNRQKVEDEKLKQKERRANLMNANRDLSDLALDANMRNDEFDANAPEAADEFVVKHLVDGTVSGVRDNSKKAYYKEFRKVVESADVILEVLDARDPLGCRAKQVEEMILAAGRDKRIVLVLNKIDLVPREAVEKWLKYLRNEFPTVAFKASTQQQRSNLGQSNVSASLASEKMLNGSESLGADDLMKLLKNYCRNSNIKTAITVGVIGFPNVGKSSVINSMKRAKVCGVGSTPGLTKATQIITLDKNIKLLDCPGIVFSLNKGDNSAESVLRNCVKVELLEDPIGPVEAILKRCPADQLEKVYGIPAYRNIDDFLLQVARRQGRLRRGGVCDIPGTARSIIQDWNSGKIAYYSLPPEDSVTSAHHLSADVVQQWSNEFKIEDFSQADLLQQVSDTGDNFMAVKSSSVDVDMDAVPDSESEDDYDSEESEATTDSEDESPRAIEVPALVQAAPAAVEQKVAKKAKTKVVVKPATPQIAEVDEALLVENQQRGKALKKQQKQQKKKTVRFDPMLQ